MTETLDRKHYGRVFSRKTGKEIPADEFIVFRVHDKALLPTLRFYQERCQNICNEAQLAEMALLIEAVRGWQMLHPDRMKFPDVAPDECSTEPRETELLTPEECYESEQGRFEEPYP